MTDDDPISEVTSGPADRGFTLTHGAYRIHWPADPNEGVEITHHDEDVLPSGHPFAASLIFSLAKRVIDAETLLSDFIDAERSRALIPEALIQRAEQLVEPGEIQTYDTNLFVLARAMQAVCGLIPAEFSTRRLPTGESCVVRNGKPADGMAIVQTAAGVVRIVERTRAVVKHL